MTAKTITSTTFDAWRGPLQAPRVPVQTFTRAGVTGVGAVTGAAQPQRCEVTALLYDELATCQSAQTTVEAMVGTFVAAEDDSGNSFNHVLVESAVCSIQPAVGGAVLTCQLVLWPDDILS